MRILHLSYTSKEDNNGFDVVIKRNQSFLKKTFGEEVVLTYKLPPTSIKRLALSVLGLSGYGVTRFSEKKLLRFIKRHDIDSVFLEGSFFGRIVKLLKKHRIRSIIFSHNIESSLYRQRYRHHKNLISYSQYSFVSFNEKRTFKYASHVITLNSRDSDLLKKKYSRTADCELPISCDYRGAEDTLIKTEKKYGLFVGSNFFPNVSGISWFIKNVATKIPFETWVVGSCCDALKANSDEFPHNIKLKGFVDNLEEVYHNAAFIIVPLFMGSGMKTKTVEALSYAKTIIGTSEAFVGIEANFSKLGGICNTADEFIEKINSDSLPLYYNQYSAELFLNSYSNNVVFSRFREFIKSTSA
ncbi:MAG: glycosyltransferase [Prevotellaceae bacterium]|jgi:hypothetical protein|nr:glycosyltransferase [Prevotellaceae bacterium]